MLDYSKDRDKTKKFMQNYEKDEDTIKVNCAYDDNCYIPNTEDNESYFF